MKKIGKILCLFAVIFLLAANPVFSQMPSISDLTSLVDDFSETMARSLPFNSTMGLNWSDAYIGSILGFPPHFGVGVTFGATFAPIASLSELAEMFGFNIPIDFSVGLPMPGYLVEARVGGIILPFDVGVKFGYLDFHTDSIPFVSGLGLNSGMKYLLYGADIRYSLVDLKILPFKLSVGASLNRLEGGISTSIPIGLEYSFTNPSGGSDLRLKMANPNLAFIWDTTCFELKAHASFPVFIITPYVGAGVSWAWSRAGYKVNTSVTIEGGTYDSEDVKAELRRLGITQIDDFERGLESIKEVNGFNMRLYGGCSFNLAMFKLDLTGMFNVMDQALGFTLGIRFQL